MWGGHPMGESNGPRDLGTSGPAVLASGPRVLLMHVSTHLGHQQASRAIGQTVQRLYPQAHVTSVDASQYASRLVRWAIAQSYLSLIRHQPDVWEYLYDNPTVHRRIQWLRTLLHHYHAANLGRLLETVRPDVIACTQAYPCGIAAHFKRVHQVSIPLVGVLTDYAPHLYWFHDDVDVYVVPSEEVKQRFLARGVEASRIRVLGIPIDLRFLEQVDRAALAREFGLDLADPIILIMGGGSGFGPLREIVMNLDRLPHPCQFIVVAGRNLALHHWLMRQRFRHRIVSFGYIRMIPQLMDLATLLISKPGGLTTSEALAKRLPLVMVNPIPGQEAYNARYLLAQGAAVQANSAETVRQTVRDLLDDPERIEALRRRIDEVARPMASVDIARLLVSLVEQARVSA